MNRGDRITLIKRLAATLAEMPSAEMGLTLRQFDFPNPWRENYDVDDYEYVILQLEQGEDDALAELQRHLHPADSPSAQTAEDPSGGPWERGTFRLFMSHTNAHRQRAGKLREILSLWGVDAFVAHDTIEPTREWLDEIESALRTCDALCALLTPDFVSSQWCDQEVGFAMARTVPVISLRLGADPHGFMGKYQAVTPTPNDRPWAVADKLFSALARHPLASDAMVPAVVRRYEKSRSFENTRAAFELVKGISEASWTPSLIERVLRAAEENDQVGHANLLTGESIPEAARELLSGFLPEPTASLTSDDDIPF